MPLPEQTEAVQEVIRLLEALEKKTEGKPVKECVLLKQMIETGTTPDVTALRKGLREVMFDWQIHKSDEGESNRLRCIHDQRLKSLHHIFQSWIYYAKIDKAHTLNTARLLVPNNVKGCVVLDATASRNLIYSLFKPAVVIPPPLNIRSYQNVRLHVSKGHKVGKVHLRNNAREVTGQLISELNEKLEGRKVFICCHKHVEPTLISHKTTFDLKTGHWGMVDGSNEWKDCDGNPFTLTTARYETLPFAATRF